MAPSRAARKNITIGIGPSVLDAQIVTEFKESAHKDASNWNSLLRWHRHKRGPQWDYSTAMYHIDQGSAEYYGGVEAAEPDVKIEEEKVESSPERPLHLRQSRQQGSATPTLQVSTSFPSNSANLPIMPVPQPSLNPHTPYQQGQLPHLASQTPFASAAAMPPEVRQQYEAMFYASRQRAASKQYPQQHQQQGSPANPQRFLSNPKFSPGQSIGSLPLSTTAPQMQNQGFYPSQQMQNNQAPVVYGTAPPQQIDPRNLNRPFGND
ncbi:MAG: hypothetical protein CYPHOPRED_001351 [Cyphobasidiales sp. Tagirdzhanova-0007]|nr:MAG: hypothetical protein CYPHOPRED_001351 [Cyphobasidiales sp. Tagirdzhanova-0007]